MTSPESPHILPHSVSGLMSSGLMSHTGNAEPDVNNRLVILYILIVNDTLLQPLHSSQDEDEFLGSICTSLLESHLEDLLTLDKLEGSFHVSKRNFSASAFKIGGEKKRSFFFIL